LALVTAITLIARLGIPPGKPFWVFAVNSLFFVLFLGSGLLFRRARTSDNEVKLDAI
jgi:type III secretory pathway component EscV